MTRYGLDKLSLRDWFVDLDALPDLIAAEREPIVLRLDAEPPAHVRALMQTLGVPIVVEP